MSSASSVRAIALALTAAAGCMLVYWMVDRSEEPGTPLAAPIPPAVLTESASAPLRMATAAPSLALAEAASAASTASEWTGGFTSDDPYPIVMQLRNRRAPGSHAAARDIMLACFPGMLASEHDDDVMREATTQANYAARLQARHAFVARCHRITHVAGEQMDRPVGDEHGLRFIEAAVALNRPSTPRDAKDSALREFASQGRLVSGAPHLESLASWKGERWQGNEAREDFATALRIAALRATSDATAGTEKRDLRLIERCYRYGDCKYSYDSILDKLPPERRERARQLAQEMETALRNNDLRPFLEGGR